jgi:hypothetical protein
MRREGKEGDSEESETHVDSDDVQPIKFLGNEMRKVQGECKLYRNIPSIKSARVITCRHIYYCDVRFHSDVFTHGHPIIIRTHESEGNGRSSSGLPPEATCFFICSSRILTNS